MDPLAGSPKVEVEKESLCLHFVLSKLPVHNQISLVQSSLVSPELGPLPKAILVKKAYGHTHVQE